MPWASDQQPRRVERAPAQPPAPAGGDPELQSLHQELAGYPGVELEPPHTEITGNEVVPPLRLSDADGAELSFFSTISTFGTAFDITVAELAVEAFYPANAVTATRLLKDIAPTARNGAAV